MTYGNFEWDQAEIDAAGATDRIAVTRAIRIFDRPHFKSPVSGEGKRRYAALGQVGRRIVEIVYTTRNGRVRLISVSLHATIGCKPETPCAGSQALTQGASGVDWSRAKIVTPPQKAAVSLSIDRDVIDYFKAPGPGYQRRINAALRGHMMRPSLCRR